MTAMVLRWRQTPPTIALRWRGPDGRVLALAAPDQLTPVASVIAPAGPPGVDAGAIKHAFSFGDASPALIAIAPAGSSLARVILDIAIPFDGIGATISVGTIGSPQLAMSTTDNLPSDDSVHETNPALAISGDTNVMLFVNPGAGATSGAGTVFLEVF